MISHLLVEHVSAKIINQSIIFFSDNTKIQLFFNATFPLANRPEAMTSILAGMDEWSRKTCIRFRKRTTETDYAYFTFGSG